MRCDTIDPPRYSPFEATPNRHESMFIIRPERLGPVSMTAQGEPPRNSFGGTLDWKDWSIYFGIRHDILERDTFNAEYSTSKKNEKNLRAMSAAVLIILLRAILPLLRNNSYSTPHNPRHGKYEQLMATRFVYLILPSDGNTSHPLRDSPIRNRNWKK